MQLVSEIKQLPLEPFYLLSFHVYGISIMSYIISYPEITSILAVPDNAKFTLHYLISRIRKHTIFTPVFHAASDDEGALEPKTRSRRTGAPSQPVIQQLLPQPLAIVYTR